MFNRVTLFIPIVCGVLGAIVGFFGMKGFPKLVLVGVNLFCVAAWAVLLFVAIYGFQSP